MLVRTIYLTHTHIHTETKGTEFGRLPILYDINMSLNLQLKRVYTDSFTYYTGRGWTLDYNTYWYPKF